MLKYFTAIIFILIIFFKASAQNIFNNLFVQPDEYQAVSWKAEQGLSNGSIHCMLKDVNGFLWIGTSAGLNRFDGSHFINYLPDKNKSGTINDGHILSLVEDSLHNIWMGTFKGLSCYNIKADTFSNLSPPIDSSALDPYTVPFCSTRNEVFCIEMYSRITAYNIHSFKRRIVAEHFQNDWDGNLIRAAYSVLDAYNNCVWLMGKNRLLRVSLSNKKETSYFFKDTRKVKWTGYEFYIEGMCYDNKRNLIWLNTTDGLIQFNLTDKKIYYIHEFDKIVNETPSKSGLYYTTLAGMCIDAKGRIWIGTQPNGTLIYNPETHTITQPVFNNEQEKNALYALPVYFDNTGITWCVNEGIYQLNSISAAAAHYVSDTLNNHSLSNNHVATIITGPQNKLWMGTWDGISIYDPGANSFQVLKEKYLPGFHGKNIMPLATDASMQTMWLKAWAPDALFEMDMATKKCRLIKVNDTTHAHKFDMGNMEAELARPYKDGFIFFMRGIGFFSVKKNSLVAQPIISLEQDISRIILVKNHVLFVGLINADYNLTYIEENGKWLRTSSSLDTLPWKNIYFNKADNSFWVATAKEILHYDASFHLIKSYSDGFFGNEVLSMLTDNYNNLWFVNNNNIISRLNTQTGKYLSLSEKDGMQAEIFPWEHAYIKDVYGNLYFACNKGFYKINPALFRDKYPAASVYIQSISINQNPFHSDTSANYVQQLFLKHNQNNIAIKSGVINYYAASNSILRYKLNDVTNNWQYTSEASVINFNGLQPGRYKLIIQASNAVNDFNGSEKVLWLYVAKAWWQTWWFYITVAIVAGLIFYRLIRWRVHQKFKQRLQQSEKEKQLAELKDKASRLEMETLRSQMNPHFIFNSLNSINRFILQNERAQASEYLTKFSKLVRLILQNSQSSLISLESELESLSLYLSLEALRFNYHFDYKISIAKDVDVSALQVPPLILQPYAENAIWHGLMHKEERGKLDIYVAEDNNQLCFKITDDGIGRKKAAAFASKSATKHKSMGLRITESRIAIMQQAETTKPPVTINDLSNADGSAAGTEVIIKLPAMYD